MLELNGQLVHTIPVLIGGICGYIVGTSLSMSIFDTLIQLKGLPFLPAIRNSAQYLRSAGDIMSGAFMYLAKDSTLGDLASCIKKKELERRAVPVTESRQDKTLLYSIRLGELRRYYDAYHKVDNDLA